jgi:hypothetical protein
MKDGGNSMTKPVGEPPAEERPEVVVHNRLGTVVNREAANDLFERILLSVRSARQRSEAEVNGRPR